jgi:2-amino-4-hydroxy-6-hydroxymethyldihydropteridine diphosphokinase
MEQNPAHIALALGSNLGDRQAALSAAIEGMAPYITVTAVSKVYETAPAYVTDQPAFLNAVVLGTTKLSPLILLRAVKQLEIDVGREPSFRYGPRLLDVDILFYDNQAIATAELNLPHPRMCEREFVLRPLADVAPNWVDPLSRQTVREMLEKLPKTEPICLGPLLSHAA